jgi:hypothetical protein
VNGDELVDLDGVRAFELDGFQLLVVHDEIFVLADLVALADVLACTMFRSPAIARHRKSRGALLLSTPVLGTKRTFPFAHKPFREFGVSAFRIAKIALSFVVVAQARSAAGLVVACGFDRHFAFSRRTPLNFALLFFVAINAPLVIALCWLGSARPMMRVHQMPHLDRAPGYRHRK